MRILALAAAGLLAILAACMPGADIATSPVSAPMPPVEHRRAVVGDAYLLERKDGSRFTVTMSLDRGSHWKNAGGSLDAVPR